MLSRWVGFALSLGVLGTAPSSAAQDNYGAIAVAPDGSWGSAYDQASRAEAEQTALRSCGSLSCEVKLWFRNNCGAYARGRGGEGWAYAETRAEAEQAALHECSLRGRACEVLCWACNAH